MCEATRVNKQETNNEAERVNAEKHTHTQTKTQAKQKQALQRATNKSAAKRAHETSKSDSERKLESRRRTQPGQAKVSEQCLLVLAQRTRSSFAGARQTYLPRSVRTPSVRTRTSRRINKQKHTTVCFPENGKSATVVFTADRSSSRANSPNQRGTRLRCSACYLHCSELLTAHLYTVWCRADLCIGMTNESAPAEAD